MPDWTVTTRAHDWPMREPFAIARGVQDDQPTLQLRLDDGAGHVGRGEACGVDYRGETPATMAAQLAAIAGIISGGVSRDDLFGLLPAGGARFALDAALWDLSAKRDGMNPFTAAGVVARPVAILTTIGKKQIASEVRTAGTVPEPNQSTKIGTTATFGIEEKPISRG